MFEKSRAWSSRVVVWPCCRRMIVRVYAVKLCEVIKVDVDAQT